MAWEIQWQQGVLSDHMGRKYRVALNSRGKQDKVYVQDTNAPKGYVVPEPVIKRPFLRKPMMVRGNNGELRNFKPFQPKRLHVIEARWHRVSNDISKAIASNGELAEMQEALWNHLFISPDLGRTWQPLGGLSNDYHVQYHIDEKEPE